MSEDVIKIEQIHRPVLDDPNGTSATPSEGSFTVSGTEVTVTRLAEGQVRVFADRLSQGQDRYKLGVYIGRVESITPSGEGDYVDVKLVDCHTMDVVRTKSLLPV